MIFVEELRMEQSVVLWLHADWLKTFEGVSLIDFFNWTDIRLLFVSKGSQKLRVESFVDMRANHLIPRFLFGWDTIREGFFLSPKYGFREDFWPNYLERSSDEELFHSFSRRNGESWINFVVKVDEVLIEERNSSLKTKMRDISIDSQCIIKMDLLDQSISIFFGFFGIWSEIVIEISHLALISPITIQDHLDISLLWDLFGNQILANWGPDGCDVKGFSNPDDLVECTQSLLWFIDELSVIRLDMLGYLSRIDNICAFFHADRKSLQTLSFLLQKRRGNTCHQTRI